MRQSTRLPERGERRAFLLTEKKAVCSNFVPGQARVLSMLPIDLPLRASIGQSRGPYPSGTEWRDGDVDGLKTWSMLITPLTKKKSVGSNFVPGKARVLLMKSALDAAN
jgi:hypothetical protein